MKKLNSPTFKRIRFLTLTLVLCSSLIFAACFDIYFCPGPSDSPVQLPPQCCDFSCFIGCNCETTCILNNCRCTPPTQPTPPCAGNCNCGGLCNLANCDCIVFCSEQCDCQNECEREDCICSPPSIVVPPSTHPDDCKCDYCNTFTSPPTTTPDECSCTPTTYCDTSCECDKCEPPISYQPYTGIVLSHAPGFFDNAFNLEVSVPAFPNATIYFTLDGSEPDPLNTNRLHLRPHGNLIASGYLNAGERLRVEDRTRLWRGTQLTSYSETWTRRHNMRPAHDAPILMGSSFRFRAFYDGDAVTDTKVATYIVTSNATERFANTPVVAINAYYNDFLFVYRNADRWSTGTYRGIFNFEYFTIDDYGDYARRFSLEGSTQLGGSWTRISGQRTLNVHMQRGTLNNTIHYPIFEDVDSFSRFRLWNGGNNFLGGGYYMGGDHFRDAFVQKASRDLNVLYGDSSLAIKFVNGEFWGFTQFREHTSNEQFVSAHTGLMLNNVSMMDRGLQNPAHNPYNRNWHADEVQAGGNNTSNRLYNELVAFITADGNFPLSDAPSDETIAEMFNTWFCKDNFIDYFLSNTFFNNTDWPHNNVRFFRAINPTNDGNPYGDGRWRFILHDMDHSANGTQGIHGTNNTGGNRFNNLLNPNLVPNHQGGPEFNRVLRVFANLGFVESFIARAEYALDIYLTPERMGTLHDEYVARFRPLLVDMYTRWAPNVSIATSINNSTTRFNNATRNVRHFVTNRQPVYLGQLAGLLDNAQNYVF